MLIASAVKLLDGPTWAAALAAVAFSGVTVVVSRAARRRTEHAVDAPDVNRTRPSRNEPADRPNLGLEPQ